MKSNLEINTNKYICGARETEIIRLQSTKRKSLGGKFDTNHGDSRPRLKNEFFRSIYAKYQQRYSSSTNHVIQDN